MAWQICKWHGGVNISVAFNQAAAWQRVLAQTEWRARAASEGMAASKRKSVMASAEGEQRQRGAAKKPVEVAKPSVRRRKTIINLTKARGEPYQA